MYGFVIVIYTLLMIALIVGLVCLWIYLANRFYDVAVMKGHRERKYFWICFWLGLVGYLLVIALPDRGNAVSAMPYELPKL